MVRSGWTTAGGPRRPVRPDEDLDRAGADEAVDEILRQAGGRSAPGESRRPLAAVEARVVEVGVEPVLVRDVPGQAVADAEVAARGRLRSPMPIRGAPDGPRRSRRGRSTDADEPVGAVPPPGPVRRLLAGWGPR